MRRYPKEIPAIEDHSRFLSNIIIEKDSTCWIWRRIKSTNYGVLTITGKPFLAHRVSWSIFKGKLHIDLVLDHLS